MEALTSEAFSVTARLFDVARRLDCPLTAYEQECMALRVRALGERLRSAVLDKLESERQA